MIIISFLRVTDFFPTFYYYERLNLVTDSLRSPLRSVALFDAFD